MPQDKILNINSPSPISNQGFTIPNNVKVLHNKKDDE